MRNVLLIVAVIAAAVFAGEPEYYEFASDSCGVIVELKEKYGSFFNDTGTVISLWNGCFMVSKKNKPPSIYPIANYSVSKVTKLKEEDK